MYIKHGRTRTSEISALASNKRARSLLPMSVLASDEAVIFVIGGFDGIRLLCQQPRACTSGVVQFDSRFEQKKIVDSPPRTVRVCAARESCAHHMAFGRNFTKLTAHLRHSTLADAQVQGEMH